MSDKADADFVPLQDQRGFGAGIKRKRIQFVPSVPSEPSAPSSTPRVSSAAEKYLSIVLQGSRSQDGDSQTASITDRTLGQDGLSPDIPDVPEVPSSHPSSASARTCEICHCSLLGSPAVERADANLLSTHAASIAHQYCLEHSKPPSHLDRQHVGLKYLSSHGWDPDAGQGLGATGQGIAAPLKGSVKNDMVGVGVIIDKTAAARLPKPIRLNAKRVREVGLQDRKKREQLQELFYRSDDVLHHLGKDH